jgi:hypothetical protein
MLLAACATGPMSVKSTYIEAEKQWMALVLDYSAWKQAGFVSEDHQEQIEGIFKKASVVLDTYKLLVLSGENTDDVIVTLNTLKREILIELAKRGAK